MDRKMALLFSDLLENKWGADPTLIGVNLFFESIKAHPLVFCLPAFFEIARQIAAVAIFAIYDDPVVAIDMLDDPRLVFDLCFGGPVGMAIDEITCFVALFCTGQEKQNDCTKTQKMRWACS